ncbi:MAG: class I SAM-dependent methyltransferase [Candidatus Aenigmarchaeota archaeon]|nr:class I SAM-dependent methyltransferase [Candidatus Aenigmarchaeota archaeon]
MKWEKKMDLWEKDKKHPMTHKDVDTSYAISRLDAGRMFLKHTKSNVKGKKVLDVAVGSGGILCSFAEKGAFCYGLDVEDYFLEISKARFKELKLKYKKISKWKGGGYKIPYPDEYFDFIICTDTLHHAPKWRYFVSEICRVMKPGAKIFVGEERRWFPQYILKSPHDNMPFTILLPKKLRVWIQKNILKLPSLDHYMFSFSFEIKNAFKKYGVELKDIDHMKREVFERNKYPEIIWPVYNLMFMHFIGTKQK